MNPILLILLTFNISNPGFQGTDTTTCRKFEERLYFNYLIKNIDGSQIYVDSLKSCMNDSPDLYLSLGKYFYNRQEYEKAEIEFLKGLQERIISQEQLGEFYYYLSLTAYYTGKNNLSYNYSKKALEAGYNPSWVYNNIGLVKEDRDEAISYYKKALKEDPSNDIAANNIGVTYCKIHNEKERLKYSLLADSIVKGGKAIYKSNIIRSLIELERLEEASILIKGAYEKFPNDKNIIEDYAKLLCRQEKFAEALIYARKLLQLHPSNAGEWFSIAFIYDGAGERDSAFYYYNVAVKYKPDFHEAHSNIGLIYRERGMFEKAHAKLDLALSMDSNYHYYYEQKYSIYIWQHDFTNAYLWAQKSMQRFPGRKEYELRIGFALMELKRYDEAIAFFKEGLSKEPKDDRLLNNLGRCYAGLKQKDKAFEYFERALSLNPENSYIYHNRASLYCDIGRYELACEDFKKAIDKEYTWIIDEKLDAMKMKYCPNVNSNRKILIYEYKGNKKELGKLSFIELNDSLLNELINKQTEADIKGFNIEEDISESSTSFDSFKVFPNPASGRFYVEHLENFSEPLTIKIFNENGVLVLVDTMREINKKELELKNVPAGMYVVILLTNKSVLGAKRLIVQY